jgi:hypothetical protein
VGVVKAGASVELTIGGASLGFKVDYDSEDKTGELRPRTTSNPDADASVEVGGAFPIGYGVGPSASYKIDPAGVYLSQQPYIQHP